MARRLLLLLFGLSTSCAWSPAGDRPGRTLAVRPLDASAAEFSIAFGEGELRLDPDPAVDGLAAVFLYGSEELAPRVRRSRQDGLLGVDLSDLSHPPLLGGGPSSKWNIRLGDRLPMTLDLACAEGRADVELGGLPLRRVRLDFGDTDAVVRWSKSQSEVLERLQVEADTRSLRLVSLGNAGFRHLDLVGGVGEMVLDFGGAWRESATAHIRAGVSDVRLYLPREIGVRVDLEPLRRPAVSASGFERRGDSLVNEAFGRAPVELRIALDPGMGALRIVES